MKLTLLQIVNAKPILEKLSGMSLPIKVAYRINKILSKVNSEYKSFEDTRVSLIKKFGKEQDDGNIEVVDDNRTKFFEEVTELLSEEIDLNIPLLDMNAFPDSIELSSQELSLINAFFSELE